MWPRPLAQIRAARALAGRLPRGAGVVALVLLALLAAGCELDAAVEVGLDADGGGTLGLRLAADAALIARAEQAGADPLGTLEEAVAALDERRWQVETREAAGGGREVRLARGFAEPAELEAITAELAEALAGPELRPLGPLRAELTEDEVRLEGWAGLQFGGAVVEHGGAPGEIAALLREEAAVRYRLQATFPGAVTSTNADEVDGRTAIWHIRPGERVTVRAVAERPGRGLLLPVLLGVGGLGALAVWFALRRRSDALVVDRYRR